MARQKGILKLKGTIGDITFYKSKDGYLAREKGGVDGNRIKTDPAFARTRENMAEFAKAGKASKVLRVALRNLLVNAKDSGMTSRLVRVMMQVIKADAVSTRGQRNVIDGEVDLLLNFEFNGNSKLHTGLFAPFTAAIDRVTGKLTMDLDPFVPANNIAAPEGATHYKITSAGLELDFEMETSVVATHSTAILPWNTVESIAIAHVNQLPAASTKPLFLLLGIEYFQETNGSFYPLRNCSFNPLAVVAVDGGV